MTNYDRRLQKVVQDRSVAEQVALMLRDPEERDSFLRWFHPRRGGEVYWQAVSVIQHFHVLVDDGLSLLEARLLGLQGLVAALHAQMHLAGTLDDVEGWWEFLSETPVPAELRRHVEQSVADAAPERLARWRDPLEQGLRHDRELLATLEAIRAELRACFHDADPLPLALAFRVATIRDDWDRISEYCRRRGWEFAPPPPNDEQRQNFRASIGLDALLREQLD